MASAAAVARDTKPRVDSVDTARFIGIFFVYWGHITEQIMYLHNDIAAAQYKYIYSFHMPVFFVLSGLIARDWGARMRPAQFIASRLASRFVPLLAFNLALGLVSLWSTPDFPPIPLQTAADYGHAIVMTLTRLPVFDIPTWFLLCLISVEAIHYAVYRFLRGSEARLLLAVLAFYLAGYFLNLRFDFFAAGTNYWLWNEAITAYAFYLVGVFLQGRGWLQLSAPRMMMWLGAVIAFALVYLTYDLNRGPFRLIPAVVILAAGHGHIFWFPVTALIGSAGILLLAKALPGWRWLPYMGKNALILMGLNGVVYHQVNTKLAHWFIAHAAPDAAAVTGFCLAVSIVSLVITVPLVMLLNRYLPQLVGKPTERGPLLPALLAASIVRN
ncbi:MAG TPA: acyltransferase family protein [Terriglobales bacterium]|nr:acyltransferase family protein [Terriglobales bacterium]